MITEQELRIIKNILEPFITADELIQILLKFKQNELIQKSYHEQFLNEFNQLRIDMKGTNYEANFMKRIVLLGGLHMQAMEEKDDK